MKVNQIYVNQAKMKRAKGVKDYYYVITRM